MMVLDFFKKQADKVMGDGKYMAGFGNTDSPAPETTQSRQTAAPSQPAQIARIRNEIAELIQDFKKPNLLKNIPDLIELMSTTIKYMTIGYDVLPLFPFIINVTTVSDIIVKKMAHLYLTNCARHNEELSILAINSYLKDSNDVDPKIRGLALRSLTSLRVPSVVEYMMKPIKDGLNDKNSYVRRCAIIGLLKAYYIDKNIVEDSGVLSDIINYISDKDPLVSVNAVRIILELNIQIELSTKIIYPLLNRLGEFNEWCMCTILQLLIKYKPNDQEEIINIMNLLEPVFKQSNTAVILSTINCYLKFTNDLPEIKTQVYYRMKQPIITLMLNPNFEISYCILKHLYLMLLNDSSVFQDEYRQFFLKYDENTLTQALKIKILPLLANEENYIDICSEIIEYTLNPSKLISTQSIKSLCDITLIISDSLDIIWPTLLELIEVEINHVRATTISILSIILRRYPEKAEDVIDILTIYLKKTLDPEAQTSGLWILGTFGNDNNDSPYYIETLIDEYENLKSTELKIQLLVTTLQLFITRAPEVHQMLERLFNFMINDTSNPLIVDKTLYYYNILSTNINTLKSLLIPSNNKSKDIDIKNTDHLKLLNNEFNSLSIIYDKPQDSFIYTNNISELTYDHNTKANDDEGNNSQHNSEQTAPHKPMPNQSDINLMDTISILPNVPVSQQSNNLDMFDNLMGITDNNTFNNDIIMSISFIKPDIIQPQIFQQNWQSLPDLFTENTPSNSIDIPTITRNIENNNISRLASGDKGKGLQFFFYTKDNNNNIYYISIFVDKSSFNSKVIIKSSNNDIENIKQLFTIVKDRLRQ